MKKQRVIIGEIYNVNRSVAQLDTRLTDQQNIQLKHNSEVDELLKKLVQSQAKIESAVLER